MARFKERYNDKCFGCGRTDEIYGVGAYIEGHYKRFTTLCKPCIMALGVEIKQFFEGEERYGQNGGKKKGKAESGKRAKSLGSKAYSI